MTTDNQQAPSLEKQSQDTFSHAGMSQWEKIAGFVFGLVVVGLLLTLSVLIKEPSPSQYATFKTILALAAAGIGGILAGMLHVEGSIKQWSVRASGALALFVVVYFFSPAPPNAAPEKSPVIQNVEEGGAGALHTGEGDISIDLRR